MAWSAFSEEHTDETFNRVARRLDEGVAIKNVGGYCREVARLVYPEALKGPDSKCSPLGAADLKAAPQNAAAEWAEKEARLSCLDQCLQALPLQGRQVRRLQPNLLK